MDRVNKSPNGIQSSAEEQRENLDILRCLSGNLLFCYSSVFFYTGPLKESHLHPAFFMNCRCVFAAPKLTFLLGCSGIHICILLFHELQMCFRCPDALFFCRNTEKHICFLSVPGLADVSFINPYFFKAALSAPGIPRGPRTAPIP